MCLGGGLSNLFLVFLAIDEFIEYGILSNYCRVVYADKRPFVSKINTFECATLELKL